MRLLFEIGPFKFDWCSDRIEVLVTVEKIGNRRFAVDTPEHKQALEQQRAAEAEQQAELRELRDAVEHFQKRNAALAAERDTLDSRLAAAHDYITTMRDGSIAHLARN